MNVKGANMGGREDDATIEPSKITALLALFQKAENGMYSLNKTEPCEKWLANSFCRFHARGFCKYAHGMADACPRLFELHSFKEQFCGKDICAYSDRCKFVHDEVKFELPHGLKLYYSEKEQTYRLVLKSDRSKVLVYKFAASPDMRDLQFYEEYLPIFEEIRRKVPGSRDFRPANLEKVSGQQRSMKMWKQQNRRSMRPLRQNLMTKRGQTFQRNRDDKIEIKSSNVTWVPVVNGQMMQVVPPQQTIFYTPPATQQVYSPGAGLQSFMSWGNATPMGEMVSAPLSNMSLSTQIVAGQPIPQQQAVRVMPQEYQTLYGPSMYYAPDQIYEDNSNLRVVYDPMDQFHTGATTPPYKSMRGRTLPLSGEGMTNIQQTPEKTKPDNTMTYEPQLLTPTKIFNPSLTAKMEFLPSRNART